LVDSAAGVAQDQRLGTVGIGKFACGVNIDSRYLELRRCQSAAIARYPDFRKMSSADARLLPQRRHQPERIFAMLHALADGVDAWVECLQRVINEHASLAAQPGL